MSNLIKVLFILLGILLIGLIIAIVEAKKISKEYIDLKKLHVKTLRTHLETLALYKNYLKENNLETNFNLYAKEHLEHKKDRE